MNTREEFEACLREIQPTNPFLAARWRELGLAVPDTAGDVATAEPEGDVPEWGVG